MTEPTDSTGPRQMPGTGTRIKLARVERGWSQRQLAEASGVDQGDISKIESGKQSPTGATYDRLMAALGGSAAIEALDGTVGIRWREAGKLRRVNTLAEAPPIVWNVDGLVARGAVTMVAGAPGAGKSIFTESLGVTMAMANPEQGPARRAGYDVHPGKVLILDAENGEHLIQRRAQAMGLTEDGADRYVVLEADGFDLESDSGSLEQLIRAEAPDMLIVDSWMSLWSGSENSSDAVKRCLNGLRELARTHNIGVLLIHHTKKDSEGYRGSGAIAATIEAVFSFVRDEDGAPEDRLIFCEKMRLDAEPKTRRVQIASHGVYDDADMA